LEATELWKRLYVVVVLILLAAGLFTLLIPPGLFPQDSELGKDYYVFSHKFNADIITGANTRQKVVALTFDDGPDPRFTPQVLRILKENKITATFFVIGEEAQLHPDLVKQEAAEGHEIENHTFTHPDLRQRTDLTTSEEILWCQSTIADLTGRSPIYFRPPRKLYNDETIQMTELYGYRLVLWTVCMENRSAPTPQAMSSRVLRYCRPGSIILAHDGRLDRTPTVKALPLLIKELKKKGYRFVTLHELLTRYHSPGQSPGDTLS
jgi:peptidoglycan/xylan/chitin deacetylase (PgdA/CDA1 family)